MSNTQLAALLAHERKIVGGEILRINSESRDRSLQVAVLVPLLASLVGFVHGFRMRRLPDIEPVANREGPDFRLIGVKS